jgi:hypothetical protein
MSQFYAKAEDEEIITPAIASHKVRHPSWSPSNFPAFMASDFKKLAAVAFALG